MNQFVQYIKVMGEDRRGKYEKYYYWNGFEKDDDFLRTDSLAFRSFDKHHKTLAVLKKGSGGGMTLKSYFNPVGYCKTSEG